MRPFFLRGLVFSPNGNDPTPEMIGELYNKNTWANLNDFSISGFTPTLNSGKIVFSGGNSDFAQYMTWGEYSCDEKLTIVVEYEWTTQEAFHAASMGVGRRSDVGSQINNEMHYDPKSEQQLLQFWQNGSIKVTKFIDVDAAVGHKLRLTFMQDRNVITGIIENLNTGLSGSLVVRGNLAANKNFQLPNMAKPCLWHHGGTQSITKLQVTSYTLKKPRVVSIGDSKTHGYSVESADGRYGELAGVVSVAVMGGDGDRTGECVLGIPYITSHMKPKYALLAIGCNDIRSGVSSGTWQANYQNIVTQLTNANITVIHVLPWPESSLDQSGLKSWIQSTYPNGKMIDPSVGWSNDIHLSGDGVHPNYAGNLYTIQKLTESGLVSGLRPQTGIAVNAMLAVSVGRRIRSGYKGNALYVRRSSDNAKAIIAYKSGVLDTVSLLAFVGGGSGYVEGIWDQSNHKFYFEQTDTSKQARIVNSGTLETKNGKPALYFDGSDYYPLKMGVFNTSVINDLSFNIVSISCTVSVTDVSSDRTIIGGENQGNLQYRVKGGNGHQNLVRQRLAEKGESNTSISNNTLTVLTARYNPPAGSSNYRRNGTDDGSPGYDGFGFGSQPVYLGAAIGNIGGETIVGHISELVMIPYYGTDNEMHTIELDQGAWSTISVA